MEPRTAGKVWGQMLRVAAIKMNGKGFRTPSFKLTERNATKYPESRRNDKKGTTKYGRGYHNRYNSVGA